MQPFLNLRVESLSFSWLLPGIPIETAGKRGYRIAKATHFSSAAAIWWAA
jgi:hypothetical protein